MRKSVDGSYGDVPDGEFVDQLAMPRARTNLLCPERRRIEAIALQRISREHLPAPGTASISETLRAWRFDCRDSKEGILDHVYPRLVSSYSLAAFYEY